MNTTTSTVVEQETVQYGLQAGDYWMRSGAEPHLRKVWALTVRLVDQATGIRKAELLGERLAVQEEALRRGYAHGQLAAW